MSSTIFYKFQSQKDTSRIQFDGTGITVFDLKRDIIQDNKLGDGTDFQIRLYNPDTMEEYDDDFVVVPRSSLVVVRRSPATHGNAGNATRYVMGKPRVIIRTSNGGGNGFGGFPGVGGGVSGINGGGNGALAAGGTEEERIARMFANQENQWQETQQAMSTAVPVYHNRSQPGGAGGQQHQDDGPPPPGYMCYRCGGKDHWIKNCPTNSDPNFEGKRIRRTTGIPKKFLKSVEIDPMTMTPEEMAEKKIMVTDDGKFVVQVADQHSWEDYQRKQQQQNIAVREQDAVWMANQFEDLPDELKCPLTGGLLREPMRSEACCKRLVSKMAMEDALLESDFVCPLCNTGDILLDSLQPDEEAGKKVQEFLKSHNNGRAAETSAEEEPSAKKAKLPSIPMPPFGMPFMFPMPFMPPVQGTPNNQNNNKT
ncbi:HDR104Cp [Eremothecium sinecaudum]|uniref:HDR104Cp n=1 Tax=Eremothecium sinecaudum TaxID=45286 RepID=A0A0X8HS56_9SACH|nr:HDR104Cp [Eremothecium sinecaudum]AMD20846.1 HDR104Cp [Eremothecium sinecaudum]